MINIEATIKFILFDKNNPKTFPRRHEPRRYLVHRIVANKTHMETWNGNGWSSSNNEPLMWADIGKIVDAMRINLENISMQEALEKAAKDKICYKSNEPCKYGCTGLCRESY